MRRFAPVTGRIPGIDDLSAKAADADRWERGPGIFAAFAGRKAARLVEDQVGKFVRGDTAGRTDFESGMTANTPLPIRGRDFDVVKAKVGKADIGKNESGVGSRGESKTIVVIPLVRGVVNVGDADRERSCAAGGDSGVGRLDSNFRKLGD